MPWPSVTFWLAFQNTVTNHDQVLTVSTYLFSKYCAIDI